MIYKIGDFRVRYDNPNVVLQKKAADYVTDDNNYDFYIKITKEAIEKEVTNSNGTVPAIRAENNLVYQSMAERITAFNSFVLHSATFDIDGVGVAFSAHSGTGKTTHMRLWQEYLGDRMVVVNGDKPIIRFFDDDPKTPYAYGTPWNGKEQYGCNMRTPLRHICFIERSDKNFVEKLEEKNAIDRIFNQVYMPKNPIAMMNTISLIDRLLSSCNLWIIHCNMESDAAKVAYSAIFENN